MKFMLFSGGKHIQIPHFNIKKPSRLELTVNLSSIEVNEVPRQSESNLIRALQLHNMFRNFLFAFLLP